MQCSQRTLIEFGFPLCVQVAQLKKLGKLDVSELEPTGEDASSL